MPWGMHRPTEVEWARLRQRAQAALLQAERLRLAQLEGQARVAGHSCSELDASIPSASDPSSPDPRVADEHRGGS
jgi:hypothetical protein